jgi:hypothetical protein
MTPEHMIGQIMGALQVAPDSIESRGTGVIVNLQYAGRRFRIHVDVYPIPTDRRKGDNNAQTDSPVVATEARALASRRAPDPPRSTVWTEAHREATRAILAAEDKAVTS